RRVRSRRSTCRPWKATPSNCDARRLEEELVPLHEEPAVQLEAGVEEDGVDVDRRRVAAPEAHVVAERDVDAGVGLLVLEEVAGIDPAPERAEPPLGGAVVDVRVVEA